MSNEHSSVPTTTEAFAACVPATETEDIESLMERYQAADQTAARTLIERLTPLLLRFFRHQGLAPDQADDLAQDTWLRIHRVRHSYRPAEPLMPWVFAIARRARVDHFRRNLRVRLHEIASDVLPEPPVPAAPFPIDDMASLTDVLPASQREVVIMLKTAGMSIEEVARATGSTVGAVKQKAHRAYRKLRELMERPPAKAERSSGAE